MEKLWSGRASGKINNLADDFNSSIGVDHLMVREDIVGSIAHAEMLGRQGIISESDETEIIKGLKEILSDLDSGKLGVDLAAEDVHTFVEQELTRRIGEAGKRLHTARSRNDQVALDERMYLRSRAGEIVSLLGKLITVLCDRAEEHAETILPGYTHLQRAQPITFGQQLMAYSAMFLRDRERITDAVRRMNVCPIGSCALAGTSYPTDRRFEAERLGFDGVCFNSIDGVSDRDYAIELAAAMALVMTHLSRLAEEIILWSSFEFGFIELTDDFTTGSSIMPQKKNPDVAELVRGKTGRVYGNLVWLLTLMKGLPLAYNKDMQEDKQAIFDSFDAVKACLEVIAPMIAEMRVREENMRRATEAGFVNATDLADYLAAKGVPFRTAYKLVGQIVGEAAAKGKTLSEITIDEYKTYSPAFEADLYDCISMTSCVKRRNSEGGTSPESVLKQVELVRGLLNDEGIH